MSLRINHNLAAINANRNLQLTTANLNDSMQKLSSGYRINAAADDPAGLVISEQFRAQIAGLDRAIENSEGSITMIQTAEGALTEINNLLISMRELAIHAANEGFNDIDQLKADQAEIENAIKTIDRIAATTQFGTKKLLDGSKDNVAAITTANSSDVTVLQSNLDSGQHSISATKVQDSSASLNTTSLGLSLASTTGTPHNLTEDIHSIDVLQASDVAKKVSGHVTLADAFGQDLVVAETATIASVSTADGSTLTQASASLGHVGDYTFTINYQENGEAPIGKQTLTISLENDDNMTDIASKLQTEINQNAYLAGKVTASAAAGNADLVIETANVGGNYSVSLDAVTTTAATAGFTMNAQTARGVADNELSFTVDTDSNANVTASITITPGTISSLTQLVADLNTKLAEAAAFGTISGAGVSDIVATLVNGDQIQFATRDEGSDYSIQLNTLSGGNEGDFQHSLQLTTDTLANVGTDSLVAFDGYTTAISSVKYNDTNTVTLYNAESDDASRGSIDLTVSNAQTGLNIGNLLLDVQAARFDVRVDGGPATSVTAGVDSVVYNADRSQSLTVNYALTSEGGTEQITNTDQSLVFQVGPNVGQTVGISIRNMAASSLGLGQAGNQFRSLADISVMTTSGAQDAQALIDTAINEVSTTRGQLGSFQKNSLESNLRNLRIASQNLTQSESIIRDTDMAAEMSEFTKNQILVQAGTAMLAQANQVPQVVLSLF